MDDDSWSAGSPTMDANVEYEALEIITLIRIVTSRSRWNHRMPQHNIGIQGDQYIIGILNGHTQNCKDLFRMEVPTFRTLCSLLCGNHLLFDFRISMTFEEFVVMSCLLVCHAQGQRIVRDRFQHSSQTINKYMRRVMKAMGAWETY